MRHRIAEAVAGLVTRRPGTVALVLVLLALVAGWRASKLQINDNQLDLISQEVPSVKATRRMIDIIGSVGFLIMPLKGTDTAHLKAVADDLSEGIRAMPEVLRVTHKQTDVQFVHDRIALYIEQDDMDEAYKRLRKKIRAVLRKANPFHFELRKSKEVSLDFTDLIEKYRKINKKSVDDPYYVDASGNMLLMIIKPAGQAADLGVTKRLLGDIEDLIARYNANNSRGAKVVEHYGPVPDRSTVTYGYTGTYKRALDDSESMRAALVPTSAVAFMGIFFYLLFTLRRVSQVLLVMVTLLVSVIMAFAFCELAVGDLNTITAILGAILMGLGIDFGIHFLFRLREEYTRTQELMPALQTTIARSGAASFSSAVTTAAALYVLTLSGFKGFSHFGLVAGTGVLLTAAMMYTTLPVVYVLVDRVWPGFKQGLMLAPSRRPRPAGTLGPYPFAKVILIASVGITVVLAVFASRISFDYDSRSIMSADRPSLVLQEEIRERYGISTDPVAIYTDTLEEAKQLYDQLTPVPEDSMIDGVISIFTVAPDPSRQQHNFEVLQKLKGVIEPIEPSMLDDKERKLYEKFLPYLEAKPFGIDDLPETITRQFTSPTPQKYPGYLTFIYPKVSLWDGTDLFQFDDEVGVISVGEKTYHSAGMAVLYAHLARTVLYDGRYLTVLAAAIIFVIILLIFLSLRAALFAMLPLVAGMLWMLGLMAVTGWRINFINIVVFPVVFGYGISNGIQLYHRYVESGSVLLAVRRTGAAVRASSITTLIGWGALLVSNHLGLQSMGILACFGIASALIVSLTILPAILQVWQDFRNNVPRGQQPLEERKAS